MRNGWRERMRSGGGLVLILGMCACSSPKASDSQGSAQSSGQVSGQAATEQGVTEQGVTKQGVVGAQGQNVGNAPQPGMPPGNAPQPGMPPGNAALPAMPGMPSQDLVPNSTQVKLSGKVILPQNVPDGSVQIDINRAAAGGGSAPSPLYSVRLPAGGPFEALLPKDTGAVILMLYVGVKNSDPGSVGAENTYSWGPLDVGEVSVSDINIDLTAAPPMAANAPAAPAGTGGDGAGAPPGGMYPGAAQAPGAPPAAGAGVQGSKQ